MGSTSLMGAIQAEPKVAQIPPWNSKFSRGAAPNPDCWTVSSHFQIYGPHAMQCHHFFQNNSQETFSKAKAWPLPQSIQGGNASWSSSTRLALEKLACKGAIHRDRTQDPVSSGQNTLLGLIILVAHCLQVQYIHNCLVGRKAQEGFPTRGPITGSWRHCERPNLYFVLCMCATYMLQYIVTSRAAWVGQNCKKKASKKRSHCYTLTSETFLRYLSMFRIRTIVWKNEGIFLEKPGKAWKKEMTILWEPWKCTNAQF